MANTLQHLKTLRDSSENTPRWMRKVYLALIEADDPFIANRVKKLSFLDGPGNLEAAIESTGWGADLGDFLRDLLDHAINKLEPDQIAQNDKFTAANESYYTKNRTVFIAHQFGDAPMIDGLKKHLEEKGFSWVEGKRDDIGSISLDILDKIRTSGFFLAVMTKKDKLDGGEYTTSSWLVEEKGAALAFGHRPLLMVEHGVAEQCIGGLQGDDQRIHFGRDEFAKKMQDAVLYMENTYIRRARLLTPGGKQAVAEIEEAKAGTRNRVMAKAKVSARIEECGRSSYRLVIENYGDSEARNIVLRMDGKPFAEHCSAVHGDGPVTHIGPHSRATMLLAIHLQCGPPFECDITWDDDSGEPGHYLTTLTF